MTPLIAFCVVSACVIVFAAVYLRMLIRDARRELEALDRLYR